MSKLKEHHLVAACFWENRSKNWGQTLIIKHFMVGLIIKKCFAHQVNFEINLIINVLEKTPIYGNLF